MSLIKKIITFLFSLFGLGVLVVFGIYLYVAPDLPSVASLKEINLQIPLRVYTQNEELIGEFGEKRRIPIEYSDIPPQLINAFLAIEDDRFFEHPGVDYAGLLRAAIVLLQTGEKKQGGSTITMQLARNYFLTQERTYERKIKEIFLAIFIERVFNKKEILDLYLNKIFLGHRAYGVGAAAQVYYGKTLAELELAEMAMIAGLPKAPSLYNPLSYPQVAVKRRNMVLARMLELDMITPDEHAQAQHAPVTARWHRAAVEVAAPYVAEMARAEMIKRYGEAAYTDGYKVITTINGAYQGSANRSLRKSLQAYDVRHGWRGAEKVFDLSSGVMPSAILESYSQVGELLPAIVTAVGQTTAQAVIKGGENIVLGESAYSWARSYVNENRRGLPPQSAHDVMKRGQLVRVLQDDVWKLRQIPDVSGAIVALDTNSGAILALSSGYDFGLSKFNRAVQLRRQPGSSFKPFVYAAALSAGYTPATIINDSPVVFSSQEAQRAWRPSNYSGRFFGPTRLREALKHSRNLISIRLADSLGLGELLKFVARFGFERKAMPRNLTFALGSGEASPIEIAVGYAAFANGGFRIEPYLLDTVYLDDIVVYQAFPRTACASCPYLEEGMASSTTEEESIQKIIEEGFAPRIISPSVAYQISDMMKDVVRGGTGRRARVLKRSDLAGKTGTTNNQVDAWFSGFNRNIVCTTWVGFDKNRGLGQLETGGRAALPMWIDFMRDVLKDEPETTFYRPDNIVTACIDASSGLLASPDDEDSIIEIFEKKHLPKDFAPRQDKKEQANKELF